MIKEIFEHRSIRQYKNTAVADNVLLDILKAGVCASTTGNMQLYSIVVTTDEQIKNELMPCHFNQPMVAQAPVLMTFCADIHRFSLWCNQRDADPGYDNFLWFINAMTDALLAAQNVVLEAEAHGLGVCYLGTAIYNADRISEILELPEGVVPVVAVTIGYPETIPDKTDRLPLEAVVHYQKYTDYTSEKIDELWREKEALPQSLKLLEDNGLPNLARIFTERRYKEEDNLTFSRKYFEILKQKGFFNQ